MKIEPDGMVLERLMRIDVGRLLRPDFRKLTLLPFVMIVAVVVNESIYINALEMNVLSYAFQGLVLLSFALMSLFYFRQGTTSWFVFVVIVLHVLLLSFTILNGTEVKKAAYLGCSIIFLAMVCDYYKARFEMLVVSFAIAFSVCVYLNLLYLMAHPELWIVDDLKSNQGYLLGSNYNGMGCRLLCAVCTSFFCLKYSKWWWLNAIPVTLISIVTLALVRSMTSLTGILLFVVCSLFHSQKLLKMAIVSMMSFFLLFQVLVCFQGRGLEHNELAVYFIEEVLGKDITFTHRTYLWDAASRIVAESPIYGYGLVTRDWFNSHMSSIAMGPHNYIWAVLIQGGVTLLALFTYFCYMSFSRLMGTTDRYVLLFYAAAAVLFIMMTMEAFPSAFIFILLILAFFAPR